MQEKPNILLITTDTQRWDTLRCMGSSFALSPGVDRLAGEGVLFEQGHTSSPVCMPARCSLMSGYHTPIHGCIENGVDRRDDIPMFTDALENQGYRNIMVGKTHFGPVPTSFHVQNITAGEKNRDVDDFYADHIRALGYSRASGYPNPIPNDVYMDAFLTDTAMNEMKLVNEAGAGPFFCFLSLPSPHGPVDPPKPWDTLYESVELPPISYREGEIRDHPIHLTRLVGTAEANSVIGAEPLVEAMGTTIDGKDRDEIDEHRRRYYGLAAYCDAQVGRVLDFLDTEGLRGNTLVIFTSDHGQQYFDHGFNDKHNWYDESWRVPFLMSMPGVLPQGETRQFAIWNDITATILAASGADHSSVQGFDLFTPLARDDPSPRKCAVASLYTSVALATKKWKLEYYLEEGAGRLFNRKEDPQEQMDLYRETEYREVRDAMTSAILEWRAGLMDIDFYHRHTGGGGPVARRIAPHTHELRGSSTESRLNEAVVRIDEKY